MIIPLPSSSSSSTSLCTTITSTISATGSTTVYVVQSGDYLYKIAQQFGVSWQSMAQANNIPAPYTIYVGEQLTIPLSTQTGSSVTTITSCSAPTTSVDSTSTSGLYIQYTVQPGDYLYEIGQQFGVSWNTIAQVNNIPSPYILYVGEVLLIPTTTTSPSSSSTTSSSTSSTILTSSSTSTSSSTYTSTTCALSALSSTTSLVTITTTSTTTIQDVSAAMQYAVDTTSTTSTTSSTTSSTSTSSSTTTDTGLTTSSSTTSDTSTSTTSTSSSTSTSSATSTSGSTTTSTTTTSSTPKQTKYVMLRFDDSFQDQWVYALPVLQQYGFKAVFAAVTGAISNQSNPVLMTGWENLSWQEFEWLYSNGFEVADHTVNHVHLISQSCASLNYQLLYSKYQLAQHGITNVPALALPYGEGLYNATVMSMIFQAGFSHVYPDDSAPIAITNYTQINTRWFAIDQVDGQSLLRFETLANESSSGFAVGFIYHHVDDHVANTPYYVNTTNFAQEMAFLNASGFTIVVPMALPGY